MEENYMVETEEENTALAIVDNDEIEEEDGMSTGAAMALGGLLTVGVIAGGKWLWGKWKKHKEKNALLSKSKKKAIDMEPATEDEPEEDEEETEE